MVIWDEAPMCPKIAFECVDRLLKEIMSSSKPFGGKVMLLGGDFRQYQNIRSQNLVQYNNLQ